MGAVEGVVGSASFVFFEISMGTTVDWLDLPAILC